MQYAVRRVDFFSCSKWETLIKRLNAYVVFLSHTHTQSGQGGRKFWEVMDVCGIVMVLLV